MTDTTLDTLLEAVLRLLKANVRSGATWELWESLEKLEALQMQRHGRPDDDPAK